MSGVVAATDLTGRLSVSEYKLRAAYLYNFSKFIRWPESAFESKDSAFVIGLLGGGCTHGNCRVVEFKDHRLPPY